MPTLNLMRGITVNIDLPYAYTKYYCQVDYKMPENIKALCTKDDLSDPEEHELVKQEFVKFLAAYLSLKRGKEKGKNSLANITDIVTSEIQVKGTNYPFERDVAGRMVRTRN